MPQSGSGAFYSLTVGSGDEDLDHIGMTLGTDQRIDVDICVRVDFQEMIFDQLTAGFGTIEDLVEIQKMFQNHISSHLSENLFNLIVQGIVRLVKGNSQGKPELHRWRGGWIPYKEA